MIAENCSRLIQPESIVSALSISELKLYYFKQFSEILDIVVWFRLSVCVESLYLFKTFFKQKWRFLNQPKIFSLWCTNYSVLVLKNAAFCSTFCTLGFECIFKFVDILSSGMETP